VTDHAEYFDEQSIARYVAECESLSDKTFCLDNPCCGVAWT